MLKYIELKNQIVSHIASGVWPKGTTLPRSDQLLQQFKVSHATLASAMKMLVADGYLERKKSVGTLVVSDHPKLPGSAGQGVIYIVDMPILDASDPSWFVPEQIFKGILNNAHYPIRMVSGRDLPPVLQAKHSGRAFIVLDAAPDLIDALRGEPHVSINRRCSNFKTWNAVNSFAIQSAYQAVMFLARELGHPKIAMLWGGGIFHQDYYAGYRLALEAFQQPFDPNLVVTQMGGEEAGYQAGAQLIKRRRLFSAVFADTDLKALGVIKAFRKAGIRVPEDISVIGIDDIPELSERQGLTTMKIPFYEMGQSAVTMAEERLNNPDGKIPAVSLYDRLIERRTCRPHA